MPKHNSKIIAAIPFLGAVIGTIATSSSAVITAGTTVFSYSVSSIVSSGFGVLIGTVIGAVFGVAVALILLGIKGLLYESSKHSKLVTGIRILGGLSTTFGTAGIGALIGSLIFPGLGTIIGGVIGLIFGIGASLITTVANCNIHNQKTNVLKPLIYNSNNSTADDNIQPSSHQTFITTLGPSIVNRSDSTSRPTPTPNLDSQLIQDSVPDPISTQKPKVG